MSGFAGKGVTIPTKPQADPEAFVRSTKMLEARCPADGKAIHELPENVIAVKKLWLNGNQAKFRFDPKTHRLTILDLVPHKDDQLAMLATLTHPVKEPPNGHPQA